MKPEMKYKHKKSDDFEILEHMELSFLWATDPNFLLFILVICTGGPEIDSVSRRLWNNLQELAYMIPYFP